MIVNIFQNDSNVFESFFPLVDLQLRFISTCTACTRINFDRQFFSSNCFLNQLFTSENFMRTITSHLTGSMLLCKLSKHVIENTISEDFFSEIEGLQNIYSKERFGSFVELQCQELT